MATLTPPHPVPARSTEPRRQEPFWRLVRGSRVVQAALVLIVLQLAYRAWATYGSYFHYDDFNFISRMLNEGLGPGVALRQYSGHVMPGAMYLSWLNNVISPYDFRVTATELWLMQAAADVGLLLLLLRMFGPRRGILPALSVYLFCPITVPVAIWWAAGVNQLPFHLALFMALWGHVAYLRDRRPRHLAVTLAWLLFGFLFYEKTLLVFGAIAIVTLCYFSSGGPVQRVRIVMARYWAAVVALVVLGVGYLALYTAYSLTFSPGRANDTALGGVTHNMVVQAYLPAVFGGPLKWWNLDQWALPTPGSLVVLVCTVLLGLLIFEIWATRARGLRALSLPLFFLGSNIVLVVAGRASFIGPLISLDFRFQGELAAVTAIALACAVMPVIGATEQVTRKRESELFDHPARVTAYVAVVAVLSLVSSTQYVRHWHASAPAKPYFTNLVRSVETAPHRLRLVDSTVPPQIMWGLAFPEDTVSHMMRQFRDQLEFPRAATDELRIVNSHGKPVPVAIAPIRRVPEVVGARCGHSVARKAVTLQLDGPVAYGGWWVRIGYISSAPSPVTITTGDVSTRTSIQSGVHALYVRGAGRFGSVRISGLQGDARLCTNDVVVGRPAPVEDK